MFATENNDTTYNERKLAFTLDSTMAIDWGSEEQAIVKTYQNDGVVTQDYEWRKYGLIVKIIRDGRRVKMEYTFRDKDNSVGSTGFRGRHRQGHPVPVRGLYGETGDKPRLAVVEQDSCAELVCCQRNRS